jgi:hypothetical protein
VAKVERSLSQVSELEPVKHIIKHFKNMTFLIANDLSVRKVMGKLIIS